MIHYRIERVIDPQLPQEQADFHRGRSTVDQVILLSQDIEDSFQDNEKTGVLYHGPERRVRYCLAPETSPEAAEDNTQSTYGKVHHGDTD